MDRRDFLNLAGQGSVVTWLASFWGKNRANASLNSPALKQTENPQELDIEHSGRRELYETKQAASTITATVVGMAVTFPYMGNNISKSGSIQFIDDQLERVPKENRPDRFLDVSRINSEHDRRQFLEQVGSGALIGGVLGPLITYFSNPGQKTANLIHGETKEGEDPVVTRHRGIKGASQNLLSNLENSAAVGGIFLLPRVTGNDNLLLSDKCKVIGKDRINNLFSEDKSEITFTCDRVEASENLLALLPDSLKDENIRLQVNIQSSGTSSGYVLDYDAKRGFYSRDIGGNPKETVIVLKNDDVVTIKRTKIRESI